MKDILDHDTSHYGDIMLPLPHPGSSLMGIPAHCEL